jgi:hypothetical protein
MSPERTNWYAEEQSIRVTPRELTERMFLATQDMVKHPNNARMAEFWDGVGLSTRDIFLFEMVKSIMPNQPPD